MPRRFLIVFAIALLPAGCATLSGEQATEAVIAEAGRAGFGTRLVEGLGYSHTVLERRESADTVWVFIEGDGSPWIEAGTKIADDPTARNPLAFKLAQQTPGWVMYLGRPCYLRAHSDARCTPALWTSDRYSDAVVASMHAALQASLDTPRPKRIVLVGYSGGGTLAVLMAQAASTDIPVAVVTVAGNLDIDAWARRHRYLPLNGSRNPADTAQLKSARLETVELHLLGARDNNVTPQMTARYLARVAPERIWRYEKFDHVCCWAQQWPEIAARIRAAIER